MDDFTLAVTMDFLRRADAVSALINDNGLLENAISVTANWRGIRIHLKHKDIFEYIPAHEFDAEADTSGGFRHMAKRYNGVEYVFLYPAGEVD